MSRSLLGVLLALAFLASARGEESADIQKLRTSIETILRETKTPAASIAVVRDGKIEWAAGLGVADLATGRRADEHTLFRIGSVTKGFVGLAALKLQEEGRLDLNAPLAKVAPELAGENAWEATDPVRLVHLLEHTSGWHDLPLRAFAWDGPHEVTLAEGLAMAGPARTSRWKPGTRFAYSNVGPAVMAAVIEKITGERFEDYMQRAWFDPLGMRDATFLGSEEVQRRLATGYRRNGGTSFPYWKIVIRPAGSINASPLDMANYVLFHVQRGQWTGGRLVDEASFARLETPTSTHAARHGLLQGYGLGNYATVEDGWIYHGHEGGARGHRTQMAYLPEVRAGYAVTINAESGLAFSRIIDALRAHIQRGHRKPAPPSPQALPSDWSRFDGWYEFVNPRVELSWGASRWSTLTRVRVLPDGVELECLGQNRVRWFHCGNGLFRCADQPAPSLALLSPAGEGLILQEGGVSGATYRRVSTGVLRLRSSLAATALGLLASTVVFTIIWVPRWLLQRSRFRGTLTLRLLPLVSALSLLGMGFVFVRSADSPWLAIEILGRLTPWSFGLFVCSTLVPLCSIAGLIQAWRLRSHAMNRVLRWHCVAASLAGLLVSAYLAEVGWLAVRTWA